jgi:hypothetical protein
MTTGRRGRDWIWLLPLLLALAGCGPGVGGTGTGEGYGLEFFGARRASVCTASFAGELKCPSRVVVGPTKPDPDEGSEPVIWVDDPAAAQVMVRINASDVELNAFCGGVQFAGTWGETNEGSRRFFGRFSVPGLEGTALGTLIVETVEGLGLSFALTDASGKTVYGPVALLRAEQDPTLSSCSAVAPAPQGGATYR